MQMEYSLQNEFGDICKGLAKYFLIRSSDDWLVSVLTSLLHLLDFKSIGIVEKCRLFSSSDEGFCIKYLDLGFRIQKNFFSILMQYLLIDFDFF
jgi:hypothetical protein